MKLKFFVLLLPILPCIFSASFNGSKVHCAPLFNLKQILLLSNSIDCSHSLVKWLISNLTLFKYSSVSSSSRFSNYSLLPSLFFCLPFEFFVSHMTTKFLAKSHFIQFFRSHFLCMFFYQSVNKEICFIYHLAYDS